MGRLANIFYWLGIKEIDKREQDKKVIKDLEVILDKLNKEERENNYTLNYVDIANEIVGVFEKYNYTDYNNIYEEENQEFNPIYLKRFKSFIPQYCIRSFIYDTLVRMISYHK